MRAQIDGAGRIVIPKQFRDKLGFADNDEVNIETAAGKIWIEPVVKQPILQKKQGVIQVTAEWVGESDVSGFMRRERDKRIRRHLDL